MAKQRTEREVPNVTLLKVDIEDPSLENERIDKLLPKNVAPSIERDDPHLTVVNTLMPEPKRETARRESELPMLKKSTIEAESANLIWLITLNELPHLTNDLMLRDEPSVLAPKMEREEPIRTTP